MNSNSIDHANQQIQNEQNLTQENTAEISYKNNPLVNQNNAQKSSSENSSIRKMKQIIQTKETKTKNSMSTDQLLVSQLDSNQENPTAKVSDKNVENSSLFQNFEMNKEANQKTLTKTHAVSFKNASKEKTNSRKTEIQNKKTPNVQPENIQLKAQVSADENRVLIATNQQNKSPQMTEKKSISNIQKAFKLGSILFKGPIGKMVKKLRSTSQRSLKQEQSEKQTKLPNKNSRIQHLKIEKVSSPSLNTKQKVNLGPLANIIIPKSSNLKIISKLKIERKLKQKSTPGKFILPASFYFPKTTNKNQLGRNYAINENKSNEEETFVNENKELQMQNNERLLEELFNEEDECIDHTIPDSRILAEASPNSAMDHKLKAKYEEFYESIVFYKNSTTAEIFPKIRNWFDFATVKRVLVFGDGFNLNFFLEGLNFDISLEQIKKFGLEKKKRAGPQSSELDQILFVNWNEIKEIMTEQMTKTYSPREKASYLSQDDKDKKKLKPFYLEEENMEKLSMKFFKREIEKIIEGDDQEVFIVTRRKINRRLVMQRQIMKGMKNINPESEVFQLGNSFKSAIEASSKSVGSKNGLIV